VVVRPPRAWEFINVRELWRFRELIFFLTWRDVKVRYKQTILGAAWAILQPAMMMVVFTLFFSRMGKMSSGDLPYPLFVFAGLLPWTFFANAITQASQSVIGSQNLITKVYFPRLAIPMGSVGAGLVDLVIAFTMLVGMVGFCVAFPGPYHVRLPGWGVLAVPFLVFVLALAALGMGALLAALTVAPFLVQLWMFATPSIYVEPDASAAHGWWHAFLPLNPAYGVILNFRRAVLGGEFDYGALAISAAASAAMLLVGCLYYRRVERHFADII
jgi:lipopolysaccharide transport system permease protein